MCGLAGIFYFKNSERSAFDAVHGMTESLRHRGPDDAGFYNDAFIALGHRRLSIIDLDTGRQPLSNEDGSIRLVLNGEIYNYKDLRSELEGTHEFKTSSDTEPVIHLYEEMGPECVKKLRGMFAFALWDSNKKQLLIARDRLGKKPLFYSLDNGRLVFASEINSLLKAGGVKREYDYSSLGDFLRYRYIPAPRTVYKNVFALEPASYMIADTSGSVKSNKYWQLDFRAKLQSGYDESKEIVKQKLIESVKLRLVSDVEVGAFLSGGIDSAVIVGLMSALSPKPVKTFTVVFENQDFSEGEYAKITAAKFGTDHKEIRVGALSVENLSSVLSYYGQPFADPSALPSYMIARGTAMHVKVALNGDGGDESMAGYLRYRALLASKLLKPFSMADEFMFKGHLSGLLASAARRMTNSSYIPRFINGLKPDYAVTNSYWHTSFGGNIKSILSESFAAEYQEENTNDYLAGLFRSSLADDFTDKALWTDYNSYLPNDLLVKMDTASMSNSLESRSPFLDHEFVELMAKIPSCWKLGFFNSKIILKDIFRDLVPPEIMNKKKTGFGLPLAKWFRNELKDYVRDTLLSNKAVNRGYFNKSALIDIIEKHQKRGFDLGLELWTLICFELWHKNQEVN